jgi:hypothetical protein
MSLFSPNANGQHHTLSPPHSHDDLDLDLDLDAINSSGEHVDQIMSKNDFEALINFDGGADLFAAEDGLGLDMDTDWMAGLTSGHEGELKTMNVDGVHLHEVDYEMDDDDDDDDDDDEYDGIAVAIAGDDDLRMDDDTLTVA